MNKNWNLYSLQLVGTLAISTYTATHLDAKYDHNGSIESYKHILMPYKFFFTFRNINYINSLY